MFEYPVTISISPNTDRQDLVQTLKIIGHPEKWLKGKEITQVEVWFKNYFGVEEAVSFNSGRSALYSLLKAFKIGSGDEVIVQAFTCIAALEPIIWRGAKPIYADIDQSLNIDPGRLERLISPKTRAIIVQHTFGIPAKIREIKKITQKHKIILIEDCAHATGATSQKQKLGTFGEAAFFSFGRDKVISSVFGGIAIVNKNREKAKILRIFQESLSFPERFWVFQQLLHPVVMSLALPFYHLKLGKILIVLLQKLNLLSKPYFCGEGEYEAKRPKCFPAKYPNGLAFILLPQLAKMEKVNRQRQKMARYYFDSLKGAKNIRLPVEDTEAIYLRFNVLVDKADDFLLLARRKKLLLGNWYRQTIDPIGVNFGRIYYKIGLCPEAEKAAKDSVNLPTYFRLTKREADSIINLLKTYDH